MLVETHAGGIDHHQFAVKTRRNRCQQPIPDPGFAPTHEPVVGGGGRPITFGDFPPGRASAEPPEDPVQHPPIIHPGHPARLVGKQGLDDRPFLVSQSYRRRAIRPSFLVDDESRKSRKLKKKFMSSRPNRAPRRMIAPRDLRRSTSDESDLIFHLTCGKRPATLINLSSYLAFFLLPTQMLHKINGKATIKADKFHLFWTNGPKKMGCKL